MGGLIDFRRQRFHLLAAALYAALAVVWTWPLLAEPATTIPGNPGDNFTFLWNYWWMRLALHEGRTFFFTPMLFAPLGADLTLHTHTALPALVGATVLASMPVPLALNLTIVGAVALSGLTAYALAWHLTASRAGALIAGGIFACSPYMAGRLMGHFNLIHAWTIPLFALTLTRWLSTKRHGDALLPGVVMGLTIYVDYYYTVFQGALLVCILCHQFSPWSLRRAQQSPRARRAVRIALTGAAVAFVAAAAIGISGGLSFSAGGQRISARGVFNPLQAGWIFAMAAGILILRPTLHRGPLPARPRTVVTGLLLLAAASALLASPILWRAAQMIVQGDYTTPVILWRSSPPGIDAATFFTGSPFHGLWGPSMRGWMEARGIDPIESSAWPGLVPVLLAWTVLRRYRSDLAVRQWAWVGAIFLLWALGPHLMVLGHNTGLVLPHALLRYVPGLSNARMPGRAIVVVYLALAVLAGVAIARLSVQGRAGRRLAVLLGALILVDYAPVPLPVTRLEANDVHLAVRQRAERGAVLELPLGVRDGLGVSGVFDDEVLWGQMQHGRPLAGGFVARLPRSVRTAYQQDALFSPLLRMSEGDNGVAPPAGERAGELLRAHGIAFIVLNRDLASTALAEYVAGELPLAHVLSQGRRSLYVIHDR